MAKVTNFIDLEEIENDDAKMCIIAQFFSGEVKKWFRSLGSGTIGTSQQLIDLFMEKWEEKKNPLQILAEYNTLKRNTNESVQEFTTRFNKIYHSIPDNIKPPPGLALLHYLGSFDPDMAYQLRERNPSTLV